MSTHNLPALGEAQIAQFIDQGFVRIDDAFPGALAAEMRAILWRDAGCDPSDPTTWTRPVIRLGYYDQASFRAAVNTPALHAAFDGLVGTGRWFPRGDLGSVVLRFPSAQDPGDTGWHVDASYPPPENEPDGAWRVNLTSRGRALLMLFLLSDVGAEDAPTRLRVGSHRAVARLLAPAGDAGLPFQNLDHIAGEASVALATGAAGTVYLCHPFLIHAGQQHRGAQPRFLAQPPLHPRVPIQLDRPDGVYSPVEIVIRNALR